MPSATTIALLTALTAQALGVWASAAQAEDRYGPPLPSNVSSQPAAPASGWLTWSAKTPAPGGAETVDVAPRRGRETTAPAMRSDRAAITALPTSLYSAYPPANPRQAPATPRSVSTAPAQAAVNQPPRFYSVHREFGLKPDPIPLPQQFFAAGGAADLAAPPPPLDPHPVPGTQAATSPLNTAANRAREVELETADSADN